MYLGSDITGFIEYRELNLSTRIDGIVRESCQTTSSDFTNEDLRNWQILYTIKKTREWWEEDSRFQCLVNLIAK